MIFSRHVTALAPPNGSTEILNTGVEGNLIRLQLYA